MLRSGRVRTLDDADLPAVEAVLDRDHITNVFVASRVGACGLDPRRLGAEVWGWYDDEQLAALCYAGANLVPVAATAPAAHAFADRARQRGRRCSSIVGPSDAVAALWDRLEPWWGQARELRLVQPLLTIDSAPQVAAHRGVRPVRPEELDLVMPACIAMFTEEVGVSPVAGDGGALYRARVAELITQGRALALIEDGEVLFKAEIGAATARSCQLQGVWVRPDLRGRGLGTAGVAAVVEHSLASVAPVVSLYVNDFNTPARRAYERVGFRTVGTLASVLF